MYVELPTYTELWSADLGREFTDAYWQTSFYFTQIYDLLLCTGEEL